MHKVEYRGEYYKGWRVDILINNHGLKFSGHTKLLVKTLHTHLDRRPQLRGV